MFGFLRRLRSRMSDDQSWKVYGVDYFTPPELAAEQEARRRGRRIVEVGVDEEGGAIFVYEGDPPPSGTTLHPIPPAKASAHA